MIKAIITPQELKKIITEYVREHFGNEVSNIKFNVNQQYTPRDEPYGYGLDSVEVCFDPKPPQSMQFPPGVR